MISGRASIVYLQLKFEEIEKKNYLTEKLLFLAEVELKKKSTPACEDRTN